MKIKTDVHSIFTYTIIFYLVIDTLNGITLRYLEFSVGQLLKVPITIYMLYFLVSNRNRDGIVVLGLLGFYLLILLVQFPFHNSLSFFKNDIVHFNKGVLPLISYIFFTELSKYTDIERLFRIIILVNLAIISLNFIAGLFGLGYYQYASLKIGTRGFFYAGNEVSGVMIIIFTHFLFFSIKQNNFRFLVASISILFLSILKATKTAIISSAIIILVIPFCLEQGKLTRLTRFKGNLLVLFFVSAPILLGVIFYGIQEVGLFERLTYFSKRYDIVTFLLSSRNKDVLYSMHNYINDYNLAQKFFGVGQSFFSEKYYDGLRNSVEIDIFDTLFFYGIIGLFLFLFIWCFFLLRSFSKINNSNYPYAYPVFISNLFLILSSLTAGHIFFSGMIGIFVGLSNSMVMIKSERWQD